MSEAAASAPSPTLVAARRAPRLVLGDVLWEAWRRVSTDRGAAGVNKQMLAEVEAYGVERSLDELKYALPRGGTRGPVFNRP